MSCIKSRKTLYYAHFLIVCYRQCSIYIYICVCVCVYVYIYIFFPLGSRSRLYKILTHGPFYTPRPQLPPWIWPQTLHARNVTALPVHEMGLSLLIVPTLTNWPITNFSSYMLKLQCSLRASRPSILKVAAEKCSNMTFVFCRPHCAANQKMVNYVAPAGCFCNPARCLHILITLAAGNL